MKNVRNPITHLGLPSLAVAALILFSAGAAGSALADTTTATESHSMPSGGGIAALSYELSGRNCKKGFAKCVKMEDFSFTVFSADKSVFDHLNYHVSARVENGFGNLAIAKLIGHASGFDADNLDPKVCTTANISGMVPSKFFTGWRGVDSHPGKNCEWLQWVVGPKEAVVSVPYTFRKGGSAVYSSALTNATKIPY